MIPADITYIHHNSEQTKQVVVETIVQNATSDGFLEIQLTVGEKKSKLSVFYALAGTISKQSNFNDISLEQLHLVLETMGMDELNTIFDDWLKDKQLAVGIDYIDPTDIHTMMISGGDYDLIVTTQDGAKKLWGHQRKVE